LQNKVHRLLGTIQRWVSYVLTVQYIKTFKYDYLYTIRTQSYNVPLLNTIVTCPTNKYIFFNTLITFGFPLKRHFLSDKNVAITWSDLF